LSLPGFAFTKATSSLTLFTGTEGCTISTPGTSTTWVTGMKSLKLLMERFVNTPGLIAVEPTLPRTRV